MIWAKYTEKATQILHKTQLTNARVGTTVSQTSVISGGRRASGSEISKHHENVPQRRPSALALQNGPAIKTRDHPSHTSSTATTAVEAGGEMASSLSLASHAQQDDRATGSASDAEARSGHVTYGKEEHGSQYAKQTEDEDVSIVTSRMALAAENSKHQFASRSARAPVTSTPDTKSTPTKTLVPPPAKGASGRAHGPRSRNSLTTTAVHSVATSLSPLQTDDSMQRAAENDESFCMSDFVFSDVPGDSPPQTGRRPDEEGRTSGGDGKAEGDVSGHKASVLPEAKRSENKKASHGDEAERPLGAGGETEANAGAAVLERQIDRSLEASRILLDKISEAVGPEAQQPSTLVPASSFVSCKLSEARPEASGGSSPDSDEKRWDAAIDLHKEELVRKREEKDAARLLLLVSPQKRRAHEDHPSSGGTLARLIPRAGLIPRQANSSAGVRPGDSSASVFSSSSLREYGEHGHEAQSLQASNNTLIDVLHEKIHTRMLSDALRNIFDTSKYRHHEILCVRGKKSHVSAPDTASPSTGATRRTNPATSTFRGRSVDQSWRKNGSK